MINSAVFRYGEPGELMVSRDRSFNAAEASACKLLVLSDSGVMLVDSRMNVKDIKFKCWYLGFVFLSAHGNRQIFRRFQLEGIVFFQVILQDDC